LCNYWLRWTAEFEKDLDDYNSIMVKALHRFAEAFEYLRKSKKGNLGLCSGWGLSTDDMIAETYKGIRPALLSPCPDHLEKNHLEIT
jgi:5-methyltetrahydrofolate--homocysteine methyltransferase